MDMEKNEMTGKDLQDMDSMIELAPEEEEMVTGGLVDLVKHFCVKCNKYTMQYVAKNGYVCSACGTLNK